MAPAKKKAPSKGSKAPSKPKKSAKPVTKAPAKKQAKKAPAKKPAQKPAKKLVAKAPAKKAPAKKAPAKKAPAKKTPSGPKGRPFPKKVAAASASSTAKPAQESKQGKASQEAKVSSAGKAPSSAAASSAAANANDGFQRRLLLPPPPKVERKSKHALKPLRDIPTPLVVAGSENPWSKDELKEMKARLTKDLATYKQELAAAEAQAAELLQDSSDGAGDDQADAGTKTFEREHELSLVYNAQDLVLQTELALARIAAGSYTKCEICGNPIGKARLQVFPRATLCMLCKQKEERR